MGGFHNWSWQRSCFLLICNLRLFFNDSNINLMILFIIWTILQLLQLFLFIYYDFIVLVMFVVRFSWAWNTFVFHLEQLVFEELNFESLLNCPFIINAFSIVWPTSKSFMWWTVYPSVPLNAATSTLNLINLRWWSSIKSSPMFFNIHEVIILINHFVLFSLRRWKGHIGWSKLNPIGPRSNC